MAPKWQAAVLVAGVVCVVGVGAGVVYSAVHEDPEPCVVRGFASPPAQRAIKSACAELDAKRPYVWGGGHGRAPGASGGGFDCSGLMRWAWYRSTGVDYGPDPTRTQGQAMVRHGFAALADPHNDDAYRPGDVIVWRGHTAMVIGDGLMVQAENGHAGLTVKSISTQDEQAVTGVFRYSRA
ncbi:C40 family peptidase [Luteipulveratus mongoliensis]|uniref:NlpC/P60 domain-containing protein n=1 Tax=Luteipulveratus mongoliensis TaxID=571913 RepID=A0A0K1JEB1_9MICO|nr:NlpC/P60 family protein [Luteipulveratus mongoliensis]AKU15052.1 hypothetical protein VV02_02920 [Luteipulveratus mongoliensis]